MNELKQRGLVRRLNRLRSKAFSHAAELGREFCCDRCRQFAQAYLDGLTDALVIMDGREPSRPDPKAPEQP